MKIYVISLKSALKRRAQIDAQLKKLGLEYELIDAVDGRSLTEEDLRLLTNYERIHQHRKWMSNGAIGCALSHMQAYQRTVEQGVAYALVLEDDALLQKNFRSFLEAYDRKPPSFDVTLLFFMSWKTCVLQAKGKVTAGDTNIYVPKDYNQPVATTGYIITKRACEQMLQKLRPVYLASDSWGKFHKLGAVESMGCVYPVAVVEDDLKSTIDYVHTRYARVFDLIDRYRVFPLFHMLKLKRKLNREKMMEVRIE